MGVVYQSFQLLPMLTLLRKRHAADGPVRIVRAHESRERAMDLLCLVELEQPRQKFPSSFRRPAAAAWPLRVPWPTIRPSSRDERPVVSTRSRRPRLPGLRAPAGKRQDHYHVTHDNSLAPRFTRHILIQDGEILPEKAGGP